MFVWIIPFVVLISWLYQQSQFDFDRFDGASNQTEAFYRHSSQFEQSIAQQIIASYPDYQRSNNLFSSIMDNKNTLESIVTKQFPQLSEIVEPLFKQLNRRLNEEEQILLLFYEKNSVLRNTQSYLLNFTTHSDLLTDKFKIYLLDSLVRSNTASLSENAKLEAVIETLEKTINPLKQEEAQLILKHIYLYQQHLKLLDDLLLQLTSSDTVQKMQLIDDALKSHYIKNDQKVSAYKSYLFLASMLLLMGLAIVIYLLDRSNKRQQNLLHEKFKMQEMMIQSEKMLSVGGLAAGMAHEINNPLAGIVQNLQVIQNRLSTKLTKNFKTAELCNIKMENLEKYLEQRDIYNMIDAVMDSGQRAAKIVNNTLSFSRKGVGIRTNEQINDVIDQTINLSANDYDLKKKYDFRKIIITKNYTSNLPSIACEASEIQQVLFNIFKNGAQAMMDCDFDSSQKPEFKISTALTNDWGATCKTLHLN